MCFPGKSKSVKYYIMLTDIYISLSQLLKICKYLLLITQDCKLKTFIFLCVVFKKDTVVNFSLAEFESISSFLVPRSRFLRYTEQSFKNLSISVGCLPKI